MDPEYDDDYNPRHPHLIPPDTAEAERRLAKLVSIEAGTLEQLGKATFLKGWWALHWLRPGLHPDDLEDWPPDAEPFRKMAQEAFRRFAASEIEDGECYPTEAVHNRLWREMRAAFHTNRPD